MINNFKSWQYPVPVVLGGIWVNGLGVVRDLARINLKSVVLHHSADGVAGKSKYAQAIICPDPWSQPEEFADFLVDLGKKLPQKGVLFITDDKYLEVASRYKGDLEPYFHCTFPEYSSLKKMLDKFEQYQAAIRLKVPVPKTEIVTKGVTEEIFQQFKFPYLIKGLEGKEFPRVVGKQVYKVNSKADLSRFIELNLSLSLIVQEEIPGEDEKLATYGSFVNSSGEIVAEFTGRKLLQIPPHFGTCLIGESLEIPEMKSYGKMLLKEFDFHGFSQVEFKLDDRDKQYKLIEINGRFWKWHSLAAASNVNLSALAYQNITNPEGNFTIPNSQTYGTRWIVWIELFRYLLFDRSDKIGKKIKNLKYIRFPLVDALFDLRDLKPFLFYINKLIGKVSRKEALKIE